ncbi:MAG TPA: helix-turn-helix domain-containing protein [Sphingobium sp.]|uniref:TetR/AcrR family transcriptional regulator n=1 Tax=Sphingobium sp. TaxID=1912891 RepID=UPI002ED12357
MVGPDAPAPRAKGRPTLNEAGQIDCAIREAAMQMLREHGEAATLNGVAKAAGLSRKSLYARYPTKTELFLAVIRDILTGAEALTFTHGPTFEESLHNYIMAALGSIVGPGAQAIQRLMMLNPDYIATLRIEVFTAMRTIFADPLRQLLQDAQTRGQIILDDEDLTVEGITKLIVVQDMGSDHAAARTGDPDWTGRQARFLTGFICRALQAQAGPPTPP